jgi:hypothetical protein
MELFRSLTYAGTALMLTVSLPASGDTIAIQSGGGSVYSDASLTSITLSSDDSQFVTETRAGSDAGVAGGATLDLSTTIPMTNGGNHPLLEIYHGQSYQAWVSGSLQIVAKPIVAPHAPASADGAFTTFTTTFTMTAQMMMAAIVE